MNNKITLKKLQKMKQEHEKIVMITAYDALFASIFNDYVDIILVGDSLNMSFAGEDDTISATLEQMIYHTKVVAKKSNRSFVLFDMPFGTYSSVDQALANAIKVYQTSGADAIKLEGGAEKAAIVEALTQNSIAVFGHIGLQPQKVRMEGGYSIKGKDEEDKERIVADALALQKAGAAALIIEGVKPDVAQAVTQAVDIPTIGIGAGLHCDGQVLVWSDMLGLYDAFTPKFVKTYLKGRELIGKAVEEYKNDVKSGKFPTVEHTY
ncbi:MAG: 3-methyl-2-oxobutanoate hydroxymethyltransferase [Campylobacterales bacterium]|nr:3-methyl-2-oxobutanoate hydroxymethyltransferase [Campylobacterales bacterium]